MRVVVDANVLVSAVISSAGPPREVLTAWTQERFELVASPALLEELREVLARPKLRRWVSEQVAEAYLAGLGQDAMLIEDPPPIPGLTPDPDDDYLVALARAAHADCLVSGDRHLLELTDPEPPVLTPRAFLALLQGGA
ncbi:MAG: putative toxin-antitoxin system toxin component, PIN family [Solirubrobacteraceae bacterium]